MKDVAMKDSLYDRLWRRECGDMSPYSGFRGIYGTKEWIDDLDIVNELGGHTGCVNALSWSRSGRLLASGSDDQHLNIYSYQPESSNVPFALNTTVFTGHRANIFSVKFMPHSNDRTLVTCAGDSQVRVFDIEYSSHSNVAATSASTASARSRRFDNFFTSTRYLNAENTNARVYRSHADRVKRIVTESSPHLFLTCSEDGEVRQWDLRQPSTTYPPPRGGQGFMAYRPGLEHDDSNVPPPLISYKKYSLDLNTISCSPTQPHYIALGGAHLHCFLHDRRMLGRDLLAEKGSVGSSTPSAASVDEEMNKATRCVRRFAPGGKRRMKKLDDGHITACKISDANPDEMVVSWSGDHIYSFDLIRSPDAREVGSGEKKSTSKGTSTSHRRGSHSLKRKRQKPESASSHESGNRHQSRRRSVEPDAFRVQYENGESEDVPFPSLSNTASDSPEGLLERARYSVLNDAQRLSMHIAKGLVKLRRALFSLEATTRQTADVAENDLSLYADAFAYALRLASIYLPQMDEVMNQWAYPMNPSSDTVAFQQSLRRNRQATWRFVQASGALARTLARRTGGAEEWIDFQRIFPAPGEDESIDPKSQFGYDFLKAILLWLQGGREELLDGFKAGRGPQRTQGRYPIPKEGNEDTIDTVLIPYLQNLAGDIPIVNVDASRFEHDATRIVFQTQRAAVTAFSNAVRLPLEDLGTTAAKIDRRRVSSSSSQVRSLDRESTMRFWILRVGKGVLMEAGNGVDYAFVNRAFGGLNTTINDDSDSDSDQERIQEDIDPNEEEEPIRDIHLVNMGGSATRRSARHRELHLGSSAENAVSSINVDTDTSEDETSNDGDEDEDGVELSSDEEEDDDSDTDPLTRRFQTRKSRRGDVELDAPCSSHMRSYRGHCNIKTVKDVNFFGLDDEYVVSGSDSGHVFIWDRKTANLVNILEGDSEVVNVVQGHPYEPTIAASGIDNTIKIFSPDRRAQEDAQQGINILDPDNPANMLSSDMAEFGGLQSRKRIHENYRIMSQNDVERRGGMSEAYITRSMLARVAATLRGRQALGAATGGLAVEDGEDASVVLDENCLVM
ncbi:hypothetical protein NUU61_001218 [Penicillium alfredii]|uniref:Uncharacterized protein n=1 Tax=Penicillium alfredii TaxID=1506179 RepID=A0A9W9GBK9_9EURO|nr:uncharacterized protein NUU61_001218 [Penicillium alfredii]KAJ5115459.1 hypothetical protein NUU61_001218 [Penicillium alfredii]